MNLNIEWLGKIPDSWQIKKINALYKLRNEKVSDYDYNPLSVSMKGVVPQLESTAKSDDHDNRKLVRKGDFAINSRSDRRNACGISDRDGSVSLINIVLQPRDIMNPNYYNWLFHTDQFADEFYKWGHGIVDDLWTTRWNDMKNILIPYPPLEKQKRIASWLDEKCTSIDAAIAAGEKEIEKLKAYKQAVITKAVTKGLNSDVPMKETGICWIGAIPSNWTIKRIRRITQEHLQGYYDESGYVDNGYRLLRITDLRPNGGFDVNDAPFVRNKPGIRKFELKPGDFCFARTGGAGSFCYIDKIEDRVVFASYLIRFRFSNQCLDYLKYAFLSDVFLHEINNLIHGGVNQNIHAENIKDAMLPFPPLVEQKEIAKYLNLKIPRIDNLISIKQEQINKLTVYKKTVIYAYVTGKKEVPNG